MPANSVPSKVTRLMSEAKSSAKQEKIYTLWRVRCSELETRDAIEQDQSVSTTERISSVRDSKYRLQSTTL